MKRPSGTPPVAASASDSPNAAIIAPPTALTQTLRSADWTGSSISKMRAETAWSAGWARSRASRGPPATTTSCAFSAAVREPRTGAATNRAPRFATRSATDRAARVPAVDMSTSTSPGFSAARTPFGPSRTASSARSSETHVMTRSRPSAHSRGVFATRAPFAANGRARSGVRFQTVRPRPVLRMLLAIAVPIVPRPRKPIWIGMSIYLAHLSATFQRSRVTGGDESACARRRKGATLSVPRGARARSPGETPGASATDGTTGRHRIGRGGERPLVCLPRGGGRPGRARGRARGRPGGGMPALPSARRRLLVRAGCAHHVQQLRRPAGDGRGDWAGREAPRARARPRPLRPGSGRRVALAQPAEDPRPAELARGRAPPAGGAPRRQGGEDRRGVLRGARRPPELPEDPLAVPRRGPVAERRRLPRGGAGLALQEAAAPGGHPAQLRDPGRAPDALRGGRRHAGRPRAGRRRGPRAPPRGAGLRGRAVRRPDDRGGGLRRRDAGAGDRRARRSRLAAGCGGAPEDRDLLRRDAGRRHRAREDERPRGRLPRGGRRRLLLGGDAGHLP